MHVMSTSQAGPATRASRRLLVEAAVLTILVNCLWLWVAIRPDDQQQSPFYQPGDAVMVGWGVIGALGLLLLLVRASRRAGWGVLAATGLLGAVAIVHGLAVVAPALS
jgi:hypothetical protein